MIRHLVNFCVASLTIIFCSVVGWELTEHRFWFYFAGLAIAAVFSTLAILVHELGHAYAAWISGWRVHAISVRRYIFMTKRKKLITISAASKSQDIGGFVIATPPPEYAWDRHSIAITLGGAAANFAAAAICIVIGLAQYPGNMDVFVTLLGFAAVSIVFGAANLIPFKTSDGVPSDGAALIATLAGAKITKEEKFLQRAAANLCDGVSPDEWDKETIRYLINAPEENRKTTDPILAAYYLSDGNLEAARTVVRNLLPERARDDPDMVCCYAFLVAILDRDSEAARAIMEPLPDKESIRAFEYWRARVVILWLDGDQAGVNEALFWLTFRERTGADIWTKHDRLLFEAIGNGAADLPRSFGRSVEREQISEVYAAPDRSKAATPWI